jgi:DNA-3-methyladenine glycosylase I
MSADGLAVGVDGLARCAWAGQAPDYTSYHDDEWGRPVHGEVALFERITLEAFQSGLSWLTILRKRDGFRRAFAGFDPEKVAAFGDDDVTRLMGDASIVRNGAKVRAAITNAAAVVRLREIGGLDELFWSFAPGSNRSRPRASSEVPATTPESVALATSLKRNGFVFVGPTTAYAAMQACGVVDDHVVGCHVTSA